jgi:hypothetical protein
MSITDYAGLQAAVVDYMNRNDISDQTADYFISIAETRFNRRLRLRAQQDTATGSVAASVALPDDFLEVISLRLANGGITSPASYKKTGGIRDESGHTTQYSVIGTNLVFDPVGSGYTYAMEYYAKFPSIEDGSNWLIENAQDLYLYASIEEAATFIRDAEDVA